MEDWLKKELEYYNYRQSDNERWATILKISDPDDFNVTGLDKVQAIIFEAFNPRIADRCASLGYDLRNVESVKFSFNIPTPIKPSDASKIVENLINLTTISFMSKTDWDVLAALPMRNIETFTASISTHPEKMKLNALKLKELYLFFEDKDKTAKRFDFSNANGIKKLRISHGMEFDYATIRTLHSLKELLIVSDYSLQNLAWLSPDYQLEKLCASRNIVSLEGIETQRALKRIDLSWNAVTDIGPLLSLPQIEYLNMYMNTPEILPERFGDKHIPVLILSPKDHEKENLIWDLLGQGGRSVSFAAYNYIQRRNKPPQAGGVTFFTRNYKEWKALSEEEKLKKAIQQAFEDIYFTINNKEQFFKYQHYDISYKRLYLKTALERYPFLTISPEIEADYNKELSNR